MAKVCAAICTNGFYGVRRGLLNEKFSWWKFHTVAFLSRCFLNVTSTPCTSIYHLVANIINRVRPGENLRGEICICLLCSNQTERRQTTAVSHAGSPNGPVDAIPAAAISV